MKRREFIAGLGGVVAWPLAAGAQQPLPPIIGWLHGQSPESMRDNIPAFDRGLAEVGFVDGRNVRVEHHWAEGHRERYDPLAVELVRRQVAVIATDTTIFAQVAKAATHTIPLVFVAGGGSRRVRPCRELQSSRRQSHRRRHAWARPDRETS
jgi:putative tryptophan/tyrosine transport system substrate-binding protein